MQTYAVQGKRQQQQIKSACLENLSANVKSFMSRHLAWYPYNV